MSDTVRSKFVRAVATVLLVFVEAEEHQVELERENRALKSEVVSLKRELEDLQKTVEEIGGSHE